jgi:uncharacterized protein
MRKRATHPEEDATDRDHGGRDGAEGSTSDQAEGGRPVPGGATSLSAGDRTVLLALARRTLAEYLATGAVAPCETESAALHQTRGMFVTLWRAGDLRGCMGSMVGQRPLCLEVQRVALMAATDDPRFRPVTLAEVPLLRLEISVLGPLEPVDDVATIQVGVHGLLIRKGHHQGVLLPQVPLELGWDRAAFLAGLCVKADLPPDAWHTAKLYRFTAEVFAEDEPDLGPATHGGC